MLIKKSFILALVLMPLLLMSCFEVIEDVALKQDGSGTLKLTLNLSQSKTRLAAVMLMDSIHGHKVPDRAEITAHMQQSADWLKTLKGISNVTQSVDFDNFTATISFSFRQVNDINNISKKILEQYHVQTKLSATYDYDQANATFIRDYHYSNDVVTQFDGLKERDKKILNAASYTCIFRFNNTIDHYSSQGAKVSSNQQALMQRFPVSDLINGKADLSNKIQLSK